jgi:hypothetical protein
MPVSLYIYYIPEKAKKISFFLLSSRATFFLSLCLLPAGPYHPTAVTETKDAGLYLLFYDCQMDEKRKTTPAARPPINNWGKKRDGKIMSTNNRKKKFPFGPSVFIF